MYARQTSPTKTMECWICADCGTRLYHMPGGASYANRNVKQGTLDDTSWLTPAIHFWTRSAQKWVRRRDLSGAQRRFMRSWRSRRAMNPALPALNGQAAYSKIQMARKSISPPLLEGLAQRLYAITRLQDAGLTGIEITDIIKAMNDRYAQRLGFDPGTN